METIDQTTEQLMFSLIEIWKGSGKSQIAFCKEKGIAYHKFHYWLKKYSGQHSLGAPQFSQLTVASKEACGSIEVIYPDGRKVVFHQPVGPLFLRHLLG